MDAAMYFAMQTTQTNEAGERTQDECIRIIAARTPNVNVDALLDLGIDELRKAADAAAQRTVLTTWEVWTYDVWGNADDGYEVNDRNNISREYEINAPVTTNNAGTAQAFDSAYPTDEQIREALGISADVPIETDGYDLYIYVESSNDGYPLGELNCTSHASLSPIRAIDV